MKLSRRYLLIAKILLLTAILCPLAAAEVRCAGKRVERIVIGAHASEVERFAAQQLQTYLGEISGGAGTGDAGHLPIIQSDDPETLPGAGIVLGQSASDPGVARLCAAAGLKVDAAALGDDGYRIQRLGSTLLLTGPQPRSSLFAVYHLLESCGVRFFGYRARGGEIVPHHDPVEIPDLTVVEKPAMKYRFVSANNFPGSDREKLVNVADWAAKNRCNAFTLSPSRAGQTWEQIAIDEVRKRGLLIAGPGHVLAQFTPDPALFATHPEYFPLRDGQRIARVSPDWGGVPSFCASNSHAMELVVGKAVDYLESHPFIGLFAIYPPDGSQHGAQCQCEACARQSPSDWYLTFINRVAHEIETKYPATKVMWISYNECGVPPKAVRPADSGRNLVLLWCNDLRNFHEPMDADANRRPAPYLAWKPRLKAIKTDWMENPGDRDLAAWHRWKAWSSFLHASDYRGDVVLLEYYNAHVANSLRLPSLGFCQSGPWPPGGMARDFQFYRAEGIAGWQNCTDYYNDSPTPYWNRLSAQLLWNPQINVAALDADFCEQWFGPAGEVMQRYSRDLWHELSLDHSGEERALALTRLGEELAEAEALAAKSADDATAKHLRAAREFHRRLAQSATF